MVEIRVGPDGLQLIAVWQFSPAILRLPCGLRVRLLTVCAIAPCGLSQGSRNTTQIMIGPKRTIAGVSQIRSTLKEGTDSQSNLP